MEKYEKVKKIGSGTFGMVHLIRRKADGAYFALKRVPLDMNASEGTRAINNEVSHSLEKKLTVRDAFVDRYKCFKVWRMQTWFVITTALWRRTTSAS